MSEEAFGYFYPAFMLIHMEDYKDTNITANAPILFWLSESEVYKQGLKEKLRRFNSEQIGAIKAYLYYMDEHYGRDFNSDINRVLTLFDTL
jgi:hypothetical protein